MYENWNLKKIWGIIYIYFDARKTQNNIAIKVIVNTCIFKLSSIRIYSNRTASEKLAEIAVRTPGTNDNSATINYF